MKPIKKSLAPAVLTALCLTLSCIGLSAADQSADPKTSSKDQPARYNKATGIVGMEVVNQHGERLGTIKDVVFDLKAERVAYAVLGTPAPGHKLLAVPLNALIPSADSEQLILRADRASIDAAKGFAANDWPPAVSPVWAAQPGQPAAHISLPRR